MNQPAQTVCYRHPDRKGGVTCQRCERHICPDCMIGAAVGFHCPECVPGALSKPRVEVAGGDFDPHAAARVTQALVALGIAGFCYSLLTGGSFDRISTEALSRGGLFSLARVGIGAGQELVGVETGELYRLVSTAFLHDGIIHLGFNLMALWYLGQLLEAPLGRLPFACVYLVSLLGGSFGALLLAPNQPTIGASGAVFGLMGALLMIRRGRRVWRVQSGLILMLGLNLLLTFLVPRISIGGHLGGLLAGGLFAPLLVLAMSPRRRAMWAVPVLTIGVSLALVGGSDWAAAQWQDPIF